MLARKFYEVVAAEKAKHDMPLLDGSQVQLIEDQKLALGEAASTLIDLAQEHGIEVDKTENSRGPEAIVVERKVIEVRFDPNYDLKRLLTEHDAIVGVEQVAWVGVHNLLYPKTTHKEASVDIVMGFEVISAPERNAEAEDRPPEESGIFDTKFLERSNRHYPVFRHDDAYVHGEPNLSERDYLLWATRNMDQHPDYAGMMASLEVIRKGIVANLDK